MPPPPDHEADVEYADPLWFFYTSGTTGRPKAAVLTHGQMAFVVTNHLADLFPGVTERDASLVLAPLSHGAGIHQLGQVARGARTVLLPTERFDVEEAWRLVEEHRVTNMFTVPTILTALVEHDSVDRYDHSSLKHVIYAGAPMYRADQKRALQKLGPCLVQYFGLGEVTGNISVLRPDQHSIEDDDRFPWAPAAAPGRGWTSPSWTRPACAWHPARPARSASAARPSSPAISRIRRRTRRPSGGDGSTPATSATWMRGGSSTSPAGPPTCTSRAAATCTRGRWRRRS